MLYFKLEFFILLLEMNLEFWPKNFARNVDLNLAEMSAGMLLRYINVNVGELLTLTQELHVN